jgi:hypothetical protein
MEPTHKNCRGPFEQPTGGKPWSEEKDDLLLSLSVGDATGDDKSPGLCRVGSQTAGGWVQGSSQLWRPEFTRFLDGGKGVQYWRTNEFLQVLDSAPSPCQTPHTRKRNILAQNPSASRAAERESNQSPREGSPSCACPNHDLATTFSLLLPV